MIYEPGGVLRNPKHSVDSGLEDELCFLQYDLNLEQHLQLKIDTCESCIIIIVGFLLG